MRFLLAALFALTSVSTALAEKPINVNTRVKQAETWEIDCECQGTAQVCREVFTSGPNKGAKHTWVSYDSFVCRTIQVSGAYSIVTEWK